MNIVIPVISKIIGRDISNELSMFYRARSAVGASLNPQGQQFFIENWPKMVDFMETEKGREAIAVFINAWGKSVIPETLTAESVAEASNETDEITPATTPSRKPK